MSSPSRRGFLLGGAAGVAAAQHAEVAPPLPKTDFHGRQITRLLVGSNPLYGYSHFNKAYDGIMREWMTLERRLDTLRMAEAAGINTWQLHYTEKTAEDVRRYRDQGGRMHILLLADFRMEAKAIAEAAKLKPLGIAHHGGLTDIRFRQGEMDMVRDFVHAVQDAGVPAGVSTHNPAVVEYVESKGWSNQYYMTCLYHVSRTPDEVRRDLGDTPLGEPFLAKDPERMTAMVRSTKKFCFAFKLLAAGRNCETPRQVEAAFRFAFSNIKPSDAVIVGMFPKTKDEARENAEFVRQILLTT